MTRNEISRIQKRLNSLGIQSGVVDGIWGKKTAAAVRAFQRINGLRPDAIVGKRTISALFPEAIHGRDDDPALPPPSSRSSNNWPRQKDVTAFYGNVGENQTFIQLPYRMRIAWDLRKSVTRMKCHKKVAEPMKEIFVNTLGHYGEIRIKELGLDLFGGCLNVRKMRGGTRYSMHSWGIAVDLDPANNRLKWNKARARLARPEYEPFWKIVEAQGAVSLGRTRNYDWMHFQFARL